MKLIATFFFGFALISSIGGAEAQEPCWGAFCFDPDEAFNDAEPVEGDITNPNGDQEWIRPEDSELEEVAQGDLGCGCPPDSSGCVIPRGTGGYCSVSAGQTVHPAGYCANGGRAVGRLNGRTVCGNGGSYAIQYGIFWRELDGN
jgi:hypothetical protein